MSNYDYSRGYTLQELEALLAAAKVEREKYLSSVSENGSSFSRIALSEIEKKMNGILDALERLSPSKYPPKKRVSVSGIYGSILS